MTPANFGYFIPKFADAGIEFILVGGGAAIAHGSVTTTYDVDFVYSRKRANLLKLSTIFDGLEPYLRGVPKGLPFRWDLRTLESGLNFTLVTSQGEIDLLGEITGGGGYEQLQERCEVMELFGKQVKVVTLPTLIHLKRCAGRAKDLIAIPELEALLEERSS